MKRFALGLCLVVAVLSGCASSPFPVPKTVEVPVDASPTVAMPARPMLPAPASNAAADVVRAAALQLEAWRSYALSLEKLLAPYTAKSPSTPPEPAK